MKSNLIHWVELEPGRTLGGLKNVDHISPQAAHIMIPDILIGSIWTKDVSFPTKAEKINEKMKTTKKIEEKLKKEKRKLERKKLKNIL